MEAMQFKFKWIDQKGNETGFLSKKGHFDGETLFLDDVRLPAGALLGVESRGKRVVVSVLGEGGQPGHLVFLLTSGSVEKLKGGLGRARSKAWAQHHREELVKQGRGDEYYEVSCPHCEATLDLTGKPPTAQVSCEFCHTISTLDSPDGTVRAEAQYRLCDECGMYSKPRQFTIFYCYFLLVVYGWWSKQTWRCPACMRPEAWKMLFGNLLFIIGVPVALVQLFRSYGGTDVGGLYPGLDAANLKARGGNLAGAIEDYRKILQKQPTTAGVKYNIGLAFLRQNDVENAARSFEFALQDCSNYEPAASALAGCYQQLGETEKLDELKKQWGVDEDGDQDAGQDAEQEESPA